MGIFSSLRHEGGVLVLGWRGTSPVSYSRFSDFQSIRLSLAGGTDWNLPPSVRKGGFVEESQLSCQHDFLHRAQHLRTSLIIVRLFLPYSSRHQLILGTIICSMQILSANKQKVKGSAFTSRLCIWPTTKTLSRILGTCTIRGGR